MEKAIWIDCLIGNNTKSRTQDRKLAVLFAIIVLLAGCAEMAAAQQAKNPHRIGVLSPVGSIGPREEVFRQGLRELGYIEGQNIVIEWRFAGDKPERLPALAAELVGMKVEVIVTNSAPAIRAAQQATKTISIVMASAGDPVAAGFVESLARPGGNITGFTNLSPELGNKRLELLKEVFPKISRVSVFWNPDQHRLALKELEKAALATRIQLRPVEFRTINDIEKAFESAGKAGVDGLIAMAISFFVEQRVKVASLALKKRLPAIFSQMEIADAGGLMAYAPDGNENYRKAAIYVDKILKGAKPADLPVEQPTKFEFVVNLKTAKQIGVTIPQSVLFRADRVIR